MTAARRMLDSWPSSVYSAITPLRCPLRNSAIGSGSRGRIPRNAPMRASAPKERRRHVSSSFQGVDAHGLAHDNANNGRMFRFRQFSRSPGWRCSGCLGCRKRRRPRMPSSGGALRRGLLHSARSMREWHVHPVPTRLQRTKLRNRRLRWLMRRMRFPGRMQRSGSLRVCR